jgi:hypothetical protein
MDFVLRGMDVPVKEYGLSRSEDDGVTWNQISMVAIAIDDIISQAVSPTYNNDKAMFMISGAPRYSPALPALEKTCL